MYTIHINQSTNKAYGRNVNKVPIVENETRYEYTDQIKKGYSWGSSSSLWCFKAYRWSIYSEPLKLRP